MKSILIKVLGPLASTAFQDRYIVHATKDEYVLPDEMVESATSELDLALHSTAVGRDLGVGERDAIHHCLERIRRHADAIAFDKVKGTELVHENADWNAIRQTAAHLLTVLGSSLSEWELKGGGLGNGG